MADDLKTQLVALPPGDALTLRDVLEYQHGLGVPHDVLAREHYFKTWDRAVAAFGEPFDRRFEAAADSVVHGELASLQRLLVDDPALATARSAYGHHQTLLHHVAQNGIEWNRQACGAPANMPAIAQALLAAGADPNAHASSYGNTDTALTLLCSSVHPHDAGVQAPLVEVLVVGGADVNDQQCAPLWTAIIWGYPRAADALVRCGARLDNLILAAGAGDVERTRELLTVPRVDLPVPLTTKTLAAAHLLEYALIYAASCNRVGVVELLLAQNPDLTIREPFYDASAPGAARHHLENGRAEYAPLVELFRARGL